jgi:amino acid transporter
VLAIVVFSYRQTIHAYPSGGGAYIVAKENLGARPAWSPPRRCSSTTS